MKGFWGFSEVGKKQKKMQTVQIFQTRKIELNQLNYRIMTLCIGTSSDTRKLALKNKVKLRGHLVWSVEQLTKYLSNS